MKEIDNLSLAIEHARLLREKFLNDPERPGYHFVCPEDYGVPGDPNGAFYARGRYHLMYLYERRGGSFCWGIFRALTFCTGARTPTRCFR
jgi:beta-fructofuranosidase